MFNFLFIIIMGNFNYGDQSFDVLDYGVETSTPRRKYTEGPRVFANRADEEMKTLTAEDLIHPFITVFSDSGFTLHTGENKTLLRLSLAGQDYICPTNIKRMIFCITSAVYHQVNGCYKLMWKQERFKSDGLPVFLNRPLLEKAFRSLYKQVEIKLGALAEKSLKSIAWQISTEKGTFYVLWHNGCIVENSPELTFTEKEFSEMKRTYKVLRFGRCPCTDEVYRIVCA